MNMLVMPLRRTVFALDASSSDFERQFKQAVKLGYSKADMLRNLDSNERQLREAMRRNESELRQRQQHLAEAGGRDSIIEGYIRHLQGQLKKQQSELADIAVVRATLGAKS